MNPYEAIEFHLWFNTQIPVDLLGKRAATMKHALMLAAVNGAQRLVETGTTRQANNWAGDGQSTVVFGEFCKQYLAVLWSCDVDAKNICEARRIAGNLNSRICYRVGDSVEFLASFGGPIDLLYLDSFDFDRNNPWPSHDHALAEAKAAMPKLHDRSIILIDDCGLPHGGKGGKAVPFLEQHGWRVIAREYQTLLIQ